MSDFKKKTVLFVPLDCVGHVNSLVSVAECLKNLGHRTVFLFIDPMDGGLKEKGHEVYDCTTDELVPSDPASGPGSEAKWDCIVNEMGRLWRSDVMENFVSTCKVGLHMMSKDIMKNNERIVAKLDLIKPDLIIIDHYFITPALIKYNKPWARVYSASPLALHKSSDKLPPATLGLPTMDWYENPKYVEWNKTVYEVNMELYEAFNDYITKQHSLPDLPKDPVNYIYKSPYLNVYMYPKELDYDHVEQPEGWTQCDSILRCNCSVKTEAEEEQEREKLCQLKDKFELPENLKDKPGKLIFLSMGSMATGDVELMKRLLKILAKSPHRFIVSKGPNHDKYDLPDNMWGEKFVNQLQILQQVDLIITHGGNNTITETLYYGVPGILVCPIFSDQHDNAQRIVEKKLGYKINPFHCDEQELLDAVEKTLADKEISHRIKAISERMQQPENKYKAIKLFTDLVNKT